ncbi:60S ribosomal protein L23a [Pteropus alecto]|uniref:60S ribosomal protein L23a n=1 Tax=Pteropus alecto TaxID=9402 RepID=L5K4Q2_PTEAL|nr:60S ribosomal protein L23a [Pteropus alecto]
MVYASTSLISVNHSHTVDCICVLIQYVFPPRIRLMWVVVAWVARYIILLISIYESKNLEEDILEFGKLCHLNWRNKIDHYAIIKFPLTTRVSLEEDRGQLVFIVDIKANKHQIRGPMKKLYDTDMAKVKTLIKLDGEIKAYVQLAPDYDALDVANKIGII